MTTPDEAQAILPVRPEDRAAAADIARKIPIRQNLSLDILEGKCDDLVLVQAFARHRISHSLPGDVGTVRIDNLAARKAVNCVLAPLLAPYISDMPELIEVGNQACTEILAALTPSPCPGDVGILRAHFTRMMEAAANYLEPTTYVARHPQHGLNGSCRFTTEFPMPDENHSDCAKADINGRRDQAFIRDMIYMLDGPEQRAALTPSALSGDAGEGETDVEPFEREGRYIVIKKSHLTAAQLSKLKSYMHFANVGTVSAVVVEADWPEYGKVWQMIEKRVAGGAK